MTMMSGSSLEKRQELTLSVSAIDKIRTLLGEKIGVLLDESAGSLITSRLSLHVRRLGLSSFDSYIQHIIDDPGGHEMSLMINALTTNTTRFFRELRHFEIFENEILPSLIKQAKNGARVRLWSAACSSGEEAYSIAAVLLNNFPDAHNFDIRILATDVDTQTLKHAEAGVYSRASISSVPQRYVEDIFEPEQDSDNMCVQEKLKAITTFRYLNFIEPWPVSGPFQVIFCRNVAIYMPPETQSKIWTGLEAVLDPDGALFIGHSERIGPELMDRLELFGPTSFRRPQALRSQNIEHMESLNVIT